MRSCAARAASAIGERWVGSRWCGVASQAAAAFRWSGSRCLRVPRWWKHEIEEQASAADDRGSSDGPSEEDDGQEEVTSKGTGQWRWRRSRERWT